MLLMDVELFKVNLELVEICNVVMEEEFRLINEALNRLFVEVSGIESVCI